MRSIATFIILLFISFSAAGNSERAGARGTIFATIKVEDDLKAEFVSGPDSNLPEEIIAKVTSSLLGKARVAHAEARAEDGIYRVAIDWKIISVDGQDQMKFKYHDSYPYAIQQMAPEFPRVNSTTPIEIVFELSLKPDGTVSSVRRGDGFSRNTDFYHAGKVAMKRWKFSPRYEDGVAVPWEVQIPFTFNMPAEQGTEWPSGKVKVTFGLTDSGDVDWLNIDGDLPECVHEAELRQQLLAKVDESDLVGQIRAGKSTLRRGAFLHELPSCAMTGDD